MAIGWKTHLNTTPCVVRALSAASSARTTTPNPLVKSTPVCRPTDLAEHTLHLCTCTSPRYLVHPAPILPQLLVSICTIICTPSGPPLTSVSRQLVSCLLFSWSSVLRHNSPRLCIFASPRVHIGFHFSPRVILGVQYYVHVFGTKTSIVINRSLSRT